MTKDVELHSGSWKKMNSALTGVTGNSSVSSSGYGSYTNAQAGSYRVGTSSTGFAKRIEDLVKISERAKQLINEKDTDGVVSFRYHDERSNAQTLQSKLGALEKYSANVSKYLKEKIDQPFYEAMDKVGAKLEALSIQNYKTTNTVGYKRTDVIRDEYGNKVGTMEVTPKEIGIDELYKVESPYKAALQKSYEEFKNSEAYKEHKLTQDEYLMAMHHTRAFEYESIDDQKSKTELWRDLALGAGVIVLTIFCPPAGAVAGTALAVADMYSAASGKDWGTGRELDGTERGLRAAFSLFDLIPAGKYLSGLVKTGKNAGIVGVKTSLKTALKEGLEQGAKNMDNFKGVLRNAKSFGDTILSKVKTYGQQLDNLRPSKVLSKSAESLSNGLRHADNVLSEAAQNFRLNMGLEPQLVGGTMPSGGGKLSHLADNLSAFAKNLDGSVDEVVEAGQDVVDDIAQGLEKSGKQGTVYPSTYDERINQTPINNGSWTGNRGESKFISESDEVNDVLKHYDIDGIEYKDGIPDFSPVSEGEICYPDMSIDRNKNFKVADELLAKQLEVPRKEITKLRKQGKFTWHELNDMKTMQLVPSIVNSKFGHLGGVAEIKKLLGI
ncbi:HNH endonuclease [Streptococcus constellatus]|uniref:HNH endonuclease n=1 Tax=Streptococcus constellatus TaxID=76860 RepID=UPI002103A191|nr:HNH endonuclease [Streptococcus constellatus]UTX65167.1 type IV secretion protein Rhs [Streptococcus constellatus]